MQLPEPPSWDDLTEEERARQILGRIGVKPPERPLVERLLEALETGWKADEQPTPSWLARRVGAHPNTVTKALCAMQAQGTILRLARGLYVPAGMEP